MTEEYVEGIKQYHDMKIWLFLAGGLEIFLGVFFFLLGVMSVVGVLLQSFTKGPSTSLEMAIGGMLFYVLLAILTTVLGIGTIMCRKWAQAIGAAGWAVALAYGIIGMTYFFLIISEYPKMIPKPTGGAPGGPPIQNIVGVVMLIMGIVMAVFVIGVPALFFFFFKNKHVRMTCENLDNKKRWTDAVPLAVLPIIIVMGTFSISLLMTPFYKFMLPFFGQYVEGWAGAGVAVGCLGLAIFLTKTLYNLKSYAWYITFVSGITMAASIILTFIKTDFLDLYRKLGYPDQQIEMMKNVNLLPGMLSSTSMTFIFFIVYMLCIRKHFTDKDPSDLAKI